jgi:hypothetical protein
MAAPRNFNPTSAPALSEEARKAVNAAFDAMSTWRTEIVNNSDKVMQKMAAAARSLGWPDQIVDATHAQMQNITKMQTQAMDQIMDAWEEQIKSPNPSSAMLSKLKSLPGFAPVGSWLSPDSLQMAASNPLQFYIQFVEQCQKAWADTTGSWIKAGRPFSS